MKKLFVFLLLSFSFVVNAQTLNGSLKELADSKKADFELVFENTKIHGFAESDFAVYEPKWDSEKPKVISEFTTNFKKRLDGVLLFNEKLKTDYIVRIKVLSIGVKGDFLCDIFVLKKGESETVVSTISGIKGRGGKIGSRMNLIEDGAENTGEKAGDVLKKCLLKSQKKNLNAY